MPDLARESGPIDYDHVHEGHSVKIGGIQLQPGEKHVWDMPVAKSALKQVTVPCTALRGRNGGPTLAITAGCHPMELNGILATVRLAAALDPEELSGTVVIVHVQNVMGFEFKRGHTSPLDGINMGKAFPIVDHIVEDTGAASHQGRSLTYLAAETIFEQVISHADFLIDMHGGELHEWLAPNIEILPIGKSDVDERTRSFARAFGFDTIWEVPEGTIPEMPSYPGRGSAVVEAMHRGIPAVFCEVGSEGRLEESLVDFTVKSVLNVMRTYRMYPGEAEQRPAQVLSGGHVLFASRAGLFLNYSKPAQRLTPGQLLGRIIDLRGEVVEEILAPSEGVITNTITLGVANPGDMLYVIGDVKR
jgi:predicted deacylase